ncbi:MAG TPA: hypothetical protein VFV17_04885 [Usitatibacteraceae bacterium]|nr:hypothetical protein [Usitatibacteraceae bacterium]
MTSLAASLPAWANPAEIESGRKFVKDTRCEDCHAKKAGGDGTGIYTRADRKVSTLAKLTAQVARCNSELNLSLFPEDEAAIVAYLNKTYYKF